MLLFYLLLLKNIYFFRSVFFALFARPDSMGVQISKFAEKTVLHP